MGGYGSGRWGQYQKRQTVDNSLSVDLNYIFRNGGLSHTPSSLSWSTDGNIIGQIRFRFENHNGAMYLTLEYSHNKEAVIERVMLVTNPQKFGGIRYWMQCPIVQNNAVCNNRCTKLYLHSDSKFFGCRSCMNLTYNSSQTSHKFDSIYKMLAIDTGLPLDLVKLSFLNMV